MAQYTHAENNPLIGYFQKVSIMSNALVTLNTPATLEWATKNGTVKRAHSEASQSRAPSVARHAVADVATLAALQNGQYKPFLADVRGACSQAHAASLVATVANALATVVDGVPMAPAGDVLTTANKRTARAVAEWLQAPQTQRTVKGSIVREAKPLPKGKQYLADIAKQWLATMTDANMLTLPTIQADMLDAAPIHAVTSQDVTAMDDTIPQ